MKSSTIILLGVKRRTLIHASYVHDFLESMKPETVFMQLPPDLPENLRKVNKWLHSHRPLPLPVPAQINFPLLALDLLHPLAIQAPLLCLGLEADFDVLLAQQTRESGKKSGEDGAIFPSNSFKEVECREKGSNAKRKLGFAK